MTEERMKAALQNKLPDAPEGYDVRIDRKLVQLTSGTKRRAGLHAKSVIVFALVLILGIATALAATNERVNAWLYDFWPEAATTLMPADTSCVKEGIRMELVSATVRDSVLTVEFTLEDLEGDRINENTEADITMDYECVEKRFDTETKKLICTWTTELDETEDRKELELEIAMLQEKKDLNVDLFPLLEKYGGLAQYVPAPTDTEKIKSDGRADKMEVIDWRNSLDIPLSEHVLLSGIGIKDGILHVQFHYPEHWRNYVRMYKDVTGDPHYDEGYDSPYRIYNYVPYECWVYLHDYDDGEEHATMHKYEKCAASWLDWGYGEEQIRMPEYDGDLNMAEWGEQFFSVGDGLAEAKTFVAEIHEAGPPILGLWEIRVPMRLVKKIN